MEQKWPLVYLKSLMFNPCTSRILWRGKMDSAPKCWQLHPAVLPLPWICCHVLVSPDSDVFWAWSLPHHATGSLCSLVPVFTSLELFVLPPSMASSQAAAFWPSWGKAPTYKPQMDLRYRGGRRDGDVGGV